MVWKHKLFSRMSVRNRKQAVTGRNLPKVVISKRRGKHFLLVKKYSTLSKSTVLLYFTRIV